MVLFYMDDQSAFFIALLAQLVPLIVIAAVCWGIPRLRRSLNRWALALKTAPLGCFSMIVPTIALTVAEPLLLRWFPYLYAAGWTFNTAIFVGGVWAAYLLQRWLLRRAGVEPRASIEYTLAAVLLLALLGAITMTTLYFIVRLL